MAIERDLSLVRRTSGQVHMQTRRFGLSCATQAQRATPTTSCTVTPAARYEAEAATAKAHAIPMHVPSRNETRADWVSSYRSCEMMSAVTVAQIGCGRAVDPAPQKGGVG